MKEIYKQEQNINFNPKKSLAYTLHGKAFKATQRLKLQFFTT